MSVFEIIYLIIIIIYDTVSLLIQYKTLKNTKIAAEVLDD